MNLTKKNPEKRNQMFHLHELKYLSIIGERDPNILKIERILSLEIQEIMEIKVITERVVLKITRLYYIRSIFYSILQNKKRTILI